MQVIYPQSEAEMRARNVTDADLNAVMSQAHLLHIVQREGGRCRGTRA